MSEHDTVRCVLPHSREPERPRPARHGWLCIGHYRALEEALAEVPALWDESEQALVRGSGTGPKISGTKDVGLSLDDKLTKARGDLRDRLASWCVLIADEHPDGLHRPRFGANPCSDFLARWLPWIAEQLWVDDFRGELLDTLSAVRGAIQPKRLRRVDLGPCDAKVACDTDTHAEIVCVGIMRAVVCTTDDDLPAEIACSSCGLGLEPEQWRSLSRRLRGGMDPMLTAAQLSQMFRVPVGTLQRWASEDEWRRDDGRPRRYHSDDAQTSFDAHHPQAEAS